MQFLIDCATCICFLALVFLAADDFERVSPCVECGSYSHPEGNECLKPPCLLDPADIDRAGPPEFFQDADDFLLGLRVVSTDEHLRLALAKCWVYHLEVGDDVEAFDDLRLR